MGNTDRIFSFGLPLEEAVGYSQGRRVGTTLRISGQYSHDMQGNFLHPGDFERQVRTAFENMDRVLAHFNAKRNHIIETNIFVRDLEDHISEFPALHKEYFGDYRPASNLFGVVRLGFPDQLVEIAAHADLSEEG
ncbi:RidA family protein [Arthrobacter sp. TMN-37]